MRTGIPRLFRRVFAPMLCLVLAQALPARAGVACVEHGRVVATCGMTSIPIAPALARAFVVASSHAENTT